jgi:hypothetical protein
VSQFICFGFDEKLDCETMARIYGRKNCTLVIDHPLICLLFGHFLKFSLNGNEIDDEGASRIAEALKTNTWSTVLV